MEVLNRVLKEDNQLRIARELYALMLTRRSAVKKIRRELRSVARMRMWLLMHVPMSVALLCALVRMWCRCLSTGERMTAHRLHARATVSLSGLGAPRP